MNIFEYDQEKHMRQEREEAYSEGVKGGKAAGLEEGLTSLIRKSLQKESLLRRLLTNWKR